MSLCPRSAVLLSTAAGRPRVSSGILHVIFASIIRYSALNSITKQARRASTVFLCSSHSTRQICWQGLSLVFVLCFSCPSPSVLASRHHYCGRNGGTGTIYLFHALRCGPRYPFQFDRDKFVEYFEPCLERTRSRDATRTLDGGFTCWQRREEAKNSVRKRYLWLCLRER